MAAEVGAGASRSLSGFYGHLLSSPIIDFGERHYLPLTQYHSIYLVLVNRFGRRFIDESRGDEYSNQALVGQPDQRAVLLADDAMRKRYVITAPYPRGEVVDRFAEAARAGARYVISDTLPALIEGVASWGVPAAALRQTLDDYRRAAAGESVALDAPLPARPAVLETPPFHALEVQPAITFTLGGIRTDADGHVLDRDGRAIPALYAAGADAGGVYHVGYGGGLALGLRLRTSRRRGRARGTANGRQRRLIMPAQVPTRAPADVLIIGAGASGAVAAKRLGEAGFNVVCLEQGDWADYSRAHGDRADFELTAGRDWAWDPNVRRAPGDYPIDDSESDITALMYNGVGGGTVIYAAHWQRNLPSDFKVRTLDGVGDDWPLTYQELLPFYQRVERDVGVSGLGGDTAFPPWRATRRSRPMPLGRMGKRVAKAHNELGWHWWPGPNAIATRQYRRLNACVQRATCLWGCVDGAKGSFDRTHWPDAIEFGRPPDPWRARPPPCGRRGRTRAGRGVRRSGWGRASRPGVGDAARRQWDRHAQAPAAVIRSAASGRPGELVWAGRKAADDASIRHRRRPLRRRSRKLAGTVGPAHPLPGVLRDRRPTWLRTRRKMGSPTDRRPRFDDALVPLGHDPIWGPGFHETVAKRLGHSAMWGIIAEDLPEESNRVVLDERLTDSDGIPAPRLLYRLSENSSRIIDFHQARARESLQAAGAYETVVAPLIRATGWHLLGTAKMGDDPATSVVDRWGRAHDVPNLLHHRWQHLANVRRHESDRDDCRAGASHHRPHHRGAAWPEGAH